MLVAVDNAFEPEGNLLADDADSLSLNLKILSMRFLIMKHQDRLNCGLLFLPKDILHASGFVKDATSHKE